MDLANGFSMAMMEGVTSAAPATDPSFGNTVLLLACDGTNGAAATVPDQSFAAHGNGTRSGVNNDAQYSTATKKFGTASVRFDGTNDVVTWADHADWSFGNGAFTIEGWFYFDAANLEDGNALISHYIASTTNREWLLQYSGSAANILQFAASADGSNTFPVNLQYAWTPTANTWYHIAVDRSGNVFRLYLDGVMVATATNALTMFAATSTLRLGSLETAGSHFRGNMDEVRITKGVARYASDGGFTVPDAAFPRS